MRHIFFSDLDGTLLDHDTYRYDMAMDGLAMIKKRRAMLVLVSSKTLAEMKQIYEKLALDSPFVFENGGGIYWPAGEGKVENIGLSEKELRREKRSVRALVGDTVRFMDEMDIDEIVGLTALNREEAVLARERRSSFPFVASTSVNLKRINAELKKREAAVTRGGRFFHLISIQAGKGKAVMKIIEFYRAGSPLQITSVGIGDSENDIAMLEAVDLPFLVRRPDGSAIETGIGRVKTTEGIGPRGFTEAVMSVLENQ